MVDRAVELADVLLLLLRANGDWPEEGPEDFAHALVGVPAGDDAVMVDVVDRLGQEHALDDEGDRHGSKGESHLPASKLLAERGHHLCTPAKTCSSRTISVVV